MFRLNEDTWLGMFRDYGVIVPLHLNIRIFVISVGDRRLKLKNGTLSNILTYNIYYLTKSWDIKVLSSHQQLGTHRFVS